MDFSLAGADAAFLGESSGDQSGRRVAGVGDVNTDGYDDLLIGAPHNARGGENAGAAYLVYGRPDADWGDAFPLSQADVIYVGEGADHFSGYDVARAGDMDGDGIDDLLIGAYCGKTQAVPGRAYVILWRRRGPSATRRLHARRVPGQGRRMAHLHHVLQRPQWLERCRHGPPAARHFRRRPQGPQRLVRACRQRPLPAQQHGYCLAGTLHARRSHQAHQ